MALEQSRVKVRQRARVQGFNHEELVGKTKLFLQDDFIK